MDENSVDSFRKCIEEGLFQKKEGEILKVMVKFHPGTASYYSTFVRGAWKHFANLLRAGLVKRVSKTEDPVTKRMVWVYDLVDDFEARITSPARPVKVSRRKRETLTELARRKGKEIHGFIRLTPFPDVEFPAHKSLEDAVAHAYDILLSLPDAEPADKAKGESCEK